MDKSDTRITQTDGLGINPFLPDSDGCALKKVRCCMAEQSIETCVLEQLDKHESIPDSGVFASQHNLDHNVLFTFSPPDVPGPHWSSIQSCCEFHGSS
jgi:hypothetical protein